MMLLRYSCRRLFNTFKSKNDEINNQKLLSLLNKLPKLSEKKIVEEKRPIRDAETPLKKITLDRLSRMIIMYTEDPLMWNPNVLDDIFGLTPNCSHHLVNYLMPLVNKIDNKSEDIQKLCKQPFVADVGRLAKDKTYMDYVQKVIFIDANAPAPLIDDWVPEELRAEK